ncbi:MAG: xanthine dehydrogenase family protein subunit M [Holophagales bacterium]|nr:MAG: xanthine dehydrogenase family protein subunit M [Holophagales bacterium]
MRTALSSLELSQPESLGEALGMLADASAAPLTPLAGCTDVFVALNAGKLAARSFLDLSRLDELRGITTAGDRLVIGALATHGDIERSPEVRRRLPILAQAAGEVGGPQIRNRGTLGGNLATGSPAGDTLPVLAVAEATVVLRSVAGERRVPFADFYTGYRQTALRRDELIVAVEVGPLPGQGWFRKVGTRAAQAISKVVMAAVRGDTCRVAFGSVAATVVRVPRTEAALAVSLAAAQEALRGEITPIDDLRSTAAYRLRVAERLLARFWTETATT